MQVFKENSNIFKLLSEAVSEGIIVVNEEQLIVATNNATNQMFGYADDELIGKSLNILIPQQFRSSHAEHVNGFVDHGEKRKMAGSRDLYGLRKDGSQFAIEAGLNPFHIYEKSYVMALIMDVTERKASELQIKQLNENLEHKIKERTNQLNESVASLKDEIERRVAAETKIRESLKKEKELNELKTKFLSLVSHEFKTPLSGILTSATLTGKYTLEAQQAKREKHLNTIKNKVHYLDTILNDFLSVERLESGKATYNLKIITLKSAIENVINEAEMMLKEGQEITCDTNINNVSIEFDEKIFDLMLFNLIHNAIKYSPENSKIIIKTEVADDSVTLHIVDKGIGIPAEEQKFVFNRYFRAKNALLNQGTGIGLNILKSHLENLGGNIHFISEENKGSTFTVTLKTKVSIKD